MKKPDECKIEYSGYISPSTPDEIKLEILGLEFAIAESNRRISLLKQSLFFAEMMCEEMKNDNHSEAK